MTCFKKKKRKEGGRKEKKEIKTYCKAGSGNVKQYSSYFLNYKGNWDWDHKVLICLVISLGRHPAERPCHLIP